MSNPRFYRPIALLYILRKGFERLHARRMVLVAIKSKIFVHQQFGALSLRSMDLTTSLTHEIEITLIQRCTVTVATLDMKGAFNAALPGRLVNRLKEQGWPCKICDWISFFAIERSISVRLDGETGPPRKIIYGLPQGSHVLPILFMLYISPLISLKVLTKAFDYAENVAMLEVSPLLEEN